MLNLTHLPIEVLAKVIDALSDPSHVANCALTCHKLWNIASPILYRVVDLTTGSNEDDIGWADDIGRQLCLLRSIAGNPKLGGFIHSFKNHDQPHTTRSKVATDDCSSATLLSAAKSMTSVRRAWLKNNAIGCHIVSSLHLYQRLEELSVHGLNPQIEIWPRANTNLKSLTWILPPPADDSSWHSPLTIISALIKIVECTCPLLESLEISFMGVEGESFPLSTATFTSDTNPILNSARRQPLKHIKHFAIKDTSGVQHLPTFNRFLNDFVAINQESLTSIIVPIGPTRTRAELHLIESLCAHAPKLKELTLARGVDASGTPYELMSAESFLAALIPKLSAPGSAIESFTLIDIASHVTSEIFKIFGEWQGLKSLRIGDSGWLEGPHMPDGNMELNLYADDVISFLPFLPQSLEILSLTINDPMIPWCEFEDSHGLHRVGPAAFRSLRRLRAFDLCEWRYDLDLDLKIIPSFAMHWRRLPYIGDHEHPRGRYVWDNDANCRVNMDCYPNQPPPVRWDPNFGKRIEMDIYSERQNTRKQILEGQNVDTSERLQAARRDERRIKTLWITQMAYYDVDAGVEISHHHERLDAHCEDQCEPDGKFESGDHFEGADATFAWFDGDICNVMSQCTADFCNGTVNPNRKGVMYDIPPWTGKAQRWPRPWRKDLEDVGKVFLDVHKPTAAADLIGYGSYQLDT